MLANHLYTHYLFIPLQISHGPYFSIFPKITLHRCQPLAATATYTRDSLQCAQPHTYSDSK
ncbi:hypothetical protein PRUPE_6G155000 [Prunus persica]|uniref:Uncharacterized protein n=1 Tax=Prunus persica TaxID=3760 RepID=A0A251NTN8_PRUPE|nr:hypothetical protein PRUPE_6G155000 [Prunus persica]